jgi:hypothetical protein
MNVQFFHVSDSLMTHPWKFGDTLRMHLSRIVCDQSKEVSVQVVAVERTSLWAGVMATQSTGRPDRGGVSGIEAAHEVRCASRSPVEPLLDGAFWRIAVLGLCWLRSVS